MRRSRLRDLYSQNSAIASALERERLRAARDSANFKSGVDAIKGAAQGVIGLYGDTVKADEAKKEKLRLEGREDEALIKKLAREDQLAKAKQEREDKLAADQRALAAKEKADDLARKKAEDDRKAAYQEDVDAAKFNLEGFEQQDKRAKNETDAAIEREKIALEREKMNKKGSGAVPKKDITPDAKALGAVQDAQKRLEQIDRVIAGKANHNTGQIVDPALQAVSALVPESVIDLSDRNDWKAEVQEVFNAILSDQSGATVTTQEMARQLIAQLNTGMDDATFMRRAKRVRENYARDLENAKQRATPQARMEALELPAAQTDPTKMDDAALDARIAELRRKRGGP